MTVTLLRAGGVVGHDGVDTVVVDGERIRAVGAHAAVAGEVQPDLVVDAGGCWICPGFVDTHVHITGNGKPDAPLRMQQDPPERLLLQAAENARRALREGVTTLRDCGALNSVILPFRDEANRGVVAAPNVLACGAALTRTGGHGHWWGLEADTRDEVRKAVRAQSKAGADSLKVMVDGGIDLGRHTPGLLYFDADDLRVVVEEAHDWGMTVAAHCLTAAGVRAAVAAGVRSVEHAIFYEQGPDETRYDPEVGAAMVERGLYASPGPAFAYELLVDPEAATLFPRNARLFHQRLEDDARLHDQGVPIVASTDAGWYGTPFGQYARVAELLAGEVGMTPTEALASCTSVAAASLGLEHETGTVAAGKRADLVALDGDPTADVGAMRRVRLTMVRGAILHDTGLVPGATTTPAPPPAP